MPMIPTQPHIPPRPKKVDKSMKKITVIFCGTAQVSPDDFSTEYHTKQIDLTEEQVKLLKPPENMNMYKVFLEG